MADYYTLSSFAIDVKTEENCAIVEHALETLNEMIENPDGPGVSPDMAKLGQAMEITEWSCLGFDCQRMDTSTSFWFHEDESLNVDQVCEFLHYLVVKCDLDPVGFAWASICSKARLDAFDGGAAYISKDEVRYVNSSQWLAAQIDPNPDCTRGAHDL